MDCFYACTNCIFDGNNKKLRGNCSQCREGFELVVTYDSLLELNFSLDDSDNSSDSESIKYQNAIFSCEACPYGCKTCPNNNYHNFYSNPPNLNCSSCKEGYKLVDNKCVFHCQTSFPSGWEESCFRLPAAAGPQRRMQTQQENLDDVMI